jgi:glycosyltransferase involved in cell wall biosynthesis
MADPYRLGFPRVDRDFNQAIETIPFDLIHAHCPFVSGNYAYTLARKRNIPLVATFHSKYRDDFASLMHLEITIEQAVAYVVRFYEHADSVWVPNEAIIETIREYGYKGPIEYVPNGSDMALEESEESESLRAEGERILKTDRESPVLLYIGQHRLLKNLKMLLESLVHIMNHGQGFQMRFVGDGQDDDEIRKTAKNLGLSDHVKFVGRVTNRSALRSIYNATDMLLFPSVYDNASLATREAAGFYVPTLFVRGATTANGIIDGENGFLSENNPEEYGKKVIEVITNPELLKQAGLGAREYLYKSWEDVVSIVFSKYEKIVDRYKHRQLNEILKKPPAE